MTKLAIALVVSVVLVCDLIVNLHPAAAQAGWNETATIICVWGAFAWWWSE